MADFAVLKDGSQPLKMRGEIDTPGGLPRPSWREVRWLVHIQQGQFGRSPSIQPCPEVIVQQGVPGKGSHGVVGGQARPQGVGAAPPMS